MGGPPGGMLEFDAAALGSGGHSGSDAGIGSGGSSGSGGSAGASGSGGAGATFASNMPAAEVTQNTTPAAAGLVVISSRLVDEPSGSEYFQRWTALIENTGSQIVCFPQVEAAFLGASGSELASHMAFASTPAYKGASALTISCLSPGQIGGMYSNGFAQSPLELSAISSIVFTIDALDTDGVPHPAAPTLSGVQLVEKFGAGSGYWSATGSLKATATIYNIAIDAFPVGADGLVPDRLMDHHLDTLFSGQSFAFETTSYQATFGPSTVYTYTDFIEGAAYMAPPADPESAAAEGAEVHAFARRAQSPEQKYRAKQELRTFQLANAQRHAAAK